MAALKNVLAALVSLAICKEGQMPADSKERKQDDKSLSSILRVIPNFLYFLNAFLSLIQLLPMGTFDILIQIS